MSGDELRCSDLVPLCICVGRASVELRLRYVSPLPKAKRTYFPSSKLSVTELVRGWCVSGRMKPFALAGSSHTDGVERTSRANVPGKSEL